MGGVYISRFVTGTIKKMWTKSILSLCLPSHSWKYFQTWKALRKSKVLWYHSLQKTENKCSSVLPTLPSFLNCFLPLLPSTLNYVLLIIGDSHSHEIERWVHARVCVCMCVLRNGSFLSVAVAKDLKNF